jgi:glycosyltransferase involved in cell wall biosynthesis
MTYDARTPGPVPVYFLMYNADARDGVCRAVLTLADALAQVRPVEIISLYRRTSGPAYDVSEAVRVSYLFDHAAVARKDGEARRPAPRYRRRLGRHPVRNRLARRPSEITLGFGFPNFSQLTDRVLAQRLGAIERGVVISTRPALHVAAARLVRPGVVTIGQDHLNFGSRSTEPGSMSIIEEATRHGLDAFVTLTRGDADDYSQLFAGMPTRVTTIPNALSWPIGLAHATDSRTIVAAGRLVPRKGVGRLIRAFAPVARRHPDWELRIYGHGRLASKLEAVVKELGLGEQVILEGYTSDLPAAFERAAFFASASAAEGFPMVMLEALSKGLPLVSFDCPRGPSDIIRNGKNGLLVRNGRVRELSDALEVMVSDNDLRLAMSTEALADAELYLPEQVTARWTALFDELVTGRAAGTVAAAVG